MHLVRQSTKTRRFASGRTLASVAPAPRRATDAMPCVRRRSRDIDTEESMRVMDRGFRVRAGSIAGGFVMAIALVLGGARAQEQKTSVMKITLPTLNDAVHQYAKNLAAAVEKETGGRIKGEVYPASQLGPIARQIEGTQFGAIQCAIEPPEFFVGVDERFEVMTAPGLIDSMEHGQRIAADSEVKKLMLGLGANKGLRGTALFLAVPQSVLAKKAIRRLDDFKGKKLRIFASDFQFEAFKRLGASPVAMTLGDVLPAIQQGAIDGAIAGITVFTPMRFQDAAKYLTEINQPAIFLVVEFSKKWFEALPKDLQEIVDRVAVREATAINPLAIEHFDKSRKGWVAGGGELITLPPDEQASMMKTLATVGADVSKSKPALSAAFKVVTDAAERARAAK
jgi:TRAP-type C4-dicarboxylate transport system substrate-binding protein